MLIVGKLKKNLKAFGFCFVHLRKYYLPMHITISEHKPYFFLLKMTKKHSNKTTHKRDHSNVSPFKVSSHTREPTFFFMVIAFLRWMAICRI